MEFQSRLAIRPLPHQHFACSDNHSTIVKRVRKVEQFDCLWLLYHKRNDDLDHRRSAVLPQIDDELCAWLGVEQSVPRFGLHDAHRPKLFA
jgi:hypothetical protein